MNETSSRGRPSNSLHFVVGEMNGKLDQLLASILPQLQALREADSSLETRLVVVERNQWMQLGGAGILIFLVTGWEVIRYILLPS